MVASLEPGGTIQPKAAAGAGDELAAACLVVAVDGTRPLAAPSRHWLIDVEEVLLRRAPAGQELVPERAPARTLTLWLQDPMVSARHAVLRQSRGAWTLVDDGSRNGTTVNGQRTRLRRLADGDVIIVGHVALVLREAELTRAPERLDETADELYPRGLPRGMWTMSPALERDVADAVRMARSPASVVILGETGTGKELAARAIHTLSGRGGEFVPVNCGALPTELVGSEMFGHKRGAFSGAVADKDGLVTASSGGTLFLDEVGELPLPMQAAMLRALQDGEVRPVGATKAVTVDLRVVAATHVDLPAQVRAGKFREDLWSRLVGYTMRLPALRDRREDLGLLLRGMLARAGGPPPTLSDEVVAALLAHDWPRNIRQLEQAMEQALRRCDAGELALPHLPAELRARPARGRPELIELLRKHRGSTVKAADEEGVSRQAIEKRCRALDIDYKAFRTDPEPVDDEET